MNIRQCVLKRYVSMGMVVAFLITGTAACSNESGSIEGSCISVSEDGTISDCIRESFDKDYYDQQELQTQVLQAVANYNSRVGEERISVEKVQINGDVTDVKMEFRSYQDYADFNREIFFIGTPLEAQAAGFDLNQVYVGAEDDSKTMGEAQLLATTGVKVLITDTDQTIQLYDKILYVSDHVRVGEKSKSFQIVTDENNQISKEVCVIFKE